MPVPRTFPPEHITSTVRDPGVEILHSGGYTATSNAWRTRAVVIIGGVPAHETDLYYADTPDAAAEKAHDRAEAWLKEHEPALHKQYTARR